MTERLCLGRIETHHEQEMRHLRARVHNDRRSGYAVAGDEHEEMHEDDGQ